MVRKERGMNSLGITETLAQFVVDTGFKNIPRDGVDFSKRAIIDTLACMIAAVTEPVSQKITRLVRLEGSKPIASVIGSGFKTSSLNASLANGALAHALDLDDDNDSMRGHPSAVILPAILALAEELNRSGKDVITAYTVGFEVEAKVGRGVNIEHYERGWHSTSTLGTLGATAASAKMLSLDVTRTQIALGIAASLASGIRVNFGTMTKPLHVGWAAHNGVLAAKLAQEGFTAHPSVLEAEQGFCDLFCGRENCNWQSITDRMGNPFDLISPGIIPKIYPSCSLTHPAIDMILDLKRERALDPETIKKVRCGVDYRWVKTLPYHSPQLPRSGLEGKFSMEFCIAVSIVEGKAGIEQFMDEKARDPKVQSLMKKVEVYTHPELVDRKCLGRGFTLLEIELTNGEKISRRRGKPKGDPTNPLTWDELFEKYRDCGKRSFTDQVIGESLDLLQRIEELPEVTRAMNLLCKI
jgi:2-methylcitrate dehydratase PrpD